MILLPQLHWVAGITGLHYQDPLTLLKDIKISEKTTRERRACSSFPCPGMCRLSNGLLHSMESTVASLSCLSLLPHSSLTPDNLLSLPHIYCTLPNFGGGMKIMQSSKLPLEEGLNNMRKRYASKLLGLREACIWRRVSQSRRTQHQSDRTALEIFQSHVKR